MLPSGALAGAAFGSSVLGGLLSIQQGIAAKQIADANARIAENNARWARAAKVENIRQIRRQSYQVKGGQTVGFTAGGVALSGSALDTLHDTEHQFELDIMKAEMAGELTASNFEREAALYRYGGKLQARSGLLTGIGQITAGGVQALMYYERGQQRGASTSVSPADVAGGQSLNPVFRFFQQPSIQPSYALGSR